MVCPEAPLSFNGAVIRDRDEMLSLTDMWKAQGGDPARQPANWLASQEAKRFMSVLEEIHNPGISGVIAKKGKNGGTYAHWQIGLAYAKYLSPEFHMWCNTVVRERMEHKPAVSSTAARSWRTRSRRRSLRSPADDGRRGQRVSARAQGPAREGRRRCCAARRLR